MAEFEKEEVIKRLQAFIQGKFNSVAEASRKLGIPEGTIRYSYLNGKSLPGFEALYQFYLHGLDIHWLFSGFKNKLILDDEIIDRIDSLVEKLFKKINLPIDEILPYIFDSSKFISESEKKSGFIIIEWKKSQALSAKQLVYLSELTGKSVSWILTGDESLFEKYTSGLFLSYPEMEIMVKLKDHPELFKKIQKYVEVNISSNDLLGHYVVNEVDFLSDKPSKPDKKNKSSK